VNTLLFISGLSGGDTLDLLTSHPRSLVSGMLPPESDEPQSRNDLLQLEAHRIENRLLQLQQLRSGLPTQVQLAAGVEDIRVRHEEAQEQLIHMQSLSRESSVLCPAWGTIGQVSYQEGDRMVRGEKMLGILHSDRRYIMVCIAAEQVVKLQPGTHLSVDFEGHDECQGVVADLPVVTDGISTNQNNAVSVRIEPSGRGWPQVPIGSPVAVHVP